MKINVLLLILCLFLGIAVVAQTGNIPNEEKVAYYYKGKKVSLPISYEQLVIGVKPATAATAQRTIATIAGVEENTVKAAAASNQFSIKFKQHETASFIKNTINKLRASSNILYVRGSMVSSSGKMVSYGEEFIVKLKAGTTQAALQQLMNSQQCSLVRQQPFSTNIFILAAGSNSGYDGLTMANVFYESGLFEYAEPNMTTHNAIDAAPNDPLYDLQWAHNNTGSAAQFSGTAGADMGIQAAWNITMGNSNIKIAVVDDGVELTHPDLQANILQGYDATTFTADATSGSPKSPANAHGTNCAGIIAAVANNNIGVAGVAPNCKIIPVNIALASGTFSAYANIAAGIDYARINNADVISNSWGGGSWSSLLDEAILNATTLGRGGKGCVMLFSSGNNNAGISYPSVNTNVISVGGINMCNQRKSPTSCDGENWWGASYGTGLDLVAPCVKIASTDITGTNGYNTTTGTGGDYHPTFNGTSSACPNAAGVVALLLSFNNNYTLSQVRQIIEGSCTKIPAYSYSMVNNQPNGTWNSETGHGRINALAALQLAQSGLFCNVTIQANGATRFCSTGSVALSVVNPDATASYQWKKDGVDVSTGNSITAAFSGAYTVQATYVNGCMATSSAISTTKMGDGPTLSANAGRDTAICTGASVVLGAKETAKGGSPGLKEKRAYGMDWFSNSFVRFKLDEPEKFDTIAENIVSATNLSNGRFYAGGCFTPYGYLAILRSNNQLYRIDTATGVQTLLSTVNIGSTYVWSGLAWDITTQSLYGLGTFSGGSSIYIINPFTGQIKLSYPIAVGHMYSMSINQAGEMFALSTKNTTDDFVYRIDKTSGAATIMPNSIGANAGNYAQDACFDPVTGHLYLGAIITAQNTFMDLRTVNTTTGTSNVIGVLGNYAQIDALAIAGYEYTYSWSPATGLDNANVSTPIATPATTTTYVLTITDACGNTATDTVTVKVNVPGTWLGANTNWLSPLNWCGSVPTASTDVIIPAGLANYPVFGLNANLSCKDIRIDSGASFVLGSGARLLIKGTLTNNGTVTGTGDFIMNGTTQQTIQGNGTISNMQVNNLAGAVIAAGNNKLNITGTLLIYGGIILNTNDNLVLKSSATSTGKLYGFAAPYLNGKTTVERYIPGKRAYRFMSHPFQSAMPLTQVTDEVDITGNNNDIANGFTPSGTGAPSSFWYDPTTGNGSNTADPGWTAFTTAAQTVGVGDGYRLMVRGAKGNLSPVTPAPITLSTIGTLNMGDYVKTLTLGSQSGYNMIGNPFACPVNLISLTRTAAINNNFWVWNPNVGTAGGYLTYTFGVNNFSLPFSASFFVQATAAAQSVTFKEGDKVLIDTATLFRVQPMQRMVEMELLQNDQLWDRFVLQFNQKASSEKDVLLDANKFMNGSASLYSLSADGQPLAVDVRPFQEASIPLGFTSNMARPYTFHFKNCTVQDGTEELYLRDNYLQVDTKVSSGVQYPFSTNAEAASMGEQRFELVLVTKKPLMAAIEAPLQFSLSPNPAKDYVLVTFNSSKQTPTKITITNMAGQLVKSMDAGNVQHGHINVDLKVVPKGTYNITLHNNDGKTTKQLLVQ